MSNKINPLPGVTVPSFAPLSPMDGRENKGASANRGLSGAFNGLNIDNLNLSDAAKSQVTMVRSQFELNYQVLRAVNSANGFATSEVNFSFKAGYEFLQRASGRASTAAASSDGEITGTADQTSIEATQKTAEDEMANLLDYFSPENTAMRILDVATSFFAVSEIGQSEGDNEAARRKFADFIGAAINEGFAQARSIIGKVPDDITAGVDKTHALVFKGLEDFVNNGVNPEKNQPGGVYEKIAAYRDQAITAAAAIQTHTTSGTYNARGQVSNSD